MAYTFSPANPKYPPGSSNGPTLLDNEHGFLVTNLAMLSGFWGGREPNLALVTGDPIGDGTGGVYVWDPASVVTADGATIIAVPTIPVGRWIRLSLA